MMVGHSCMSYFDDTVSFERFVVAHEITYLFYFG
jgi:hypothetical protein